MGLVDHRGQALFLKVEQLPVLPAVIVRAMGLDVSSPGLFDEMLRLASEDPALAVRVLQAANSAESAPRTPVASMRVAVARLGATRITDILTAMAVTRVFVPTTAGQRDLWAHAIEVAGVSRTLVEASDAMIDPALAHSAGLLHDIGRFVMFDESPEEIGAIEDAGWQTPEELVAAELAICGVDHSELGGLVCEHWGLPPVLARVVREHHRSWQRAPSDDIKLLTALVGIADRVATIGRSTPEYAHLDRSARVELIQSRCVPGSMCSVVDAGLLVDHEDDLAAEVDRALRDLGLRTTQQSTAA